MGLIFCTCKFVGLLGSHAKPMEKWYEIAHPLKWESYFEPMIRMRWYRVLFLNLFSCFENNDGTIMVQVQWCLQAHNILEGWQGLHVIPIVCAQGLHMWMKLIYIMNLFRASTFVWCSSNPATNLRLFWYLREYTDAYPMRPCVVHQHNHAESLHFRFIRGL